MGSRGSKTALPDLRSEVGGECISCNKCVKECLFLQRYGAPELIAKSADFKPETAFECSLCALCEALCPKGLNVSGMFLQLRRDALKESAGRILKKFKKLLTYEKIGASKLLKTYYIPKGCDTALFPGCEFPHTRADLTKKLYETLRAKNNNIGVVLDCCLKISHDLGRDEYFNSNISVLQERLIGCGVKTILTVCTNCYVTLKAHLSGIEVKMVYDELGGTIKERALPVEEYHLVDPCSVRFEKELLGSVRDIASSCVQIKELEYSMEKTLCCGDGGGTEFVTPQYKENWLRKRSYGITSNVLTYCVGCTNNVQTDGKRRHLLDILLGDKKGIRKHNVLGYLKRFFLKLHFVGIKDP